MLALSAIATLVALGIAGALIVGVLERVVTQGIDQRLDAELTLMASTVGRSGVDRARLATVAGALDAGRGWRWRIDAPSGSNGSEDLVPPDMPPRPEAVGVPARTDVPHPRPPFDDDRPRPIDARDRSGEAVHERQLVVATNAGPVTLTAAAPRDVVRRPVLAALTPLLATLAALGAVLAAAALAQIRLGLRPLRRLRGGVSAIRTGRADRLSTDQPEELLPLAEELNALLRDNDAALSTARATAANLAHALKTPVATLSLALRGDPRLAQVQRIDATIRHHLARARSGAASMRVATPLRGAIHALGATIGQLRRDRAIAIAIDVPEGLAVAMVATDLDELAGNLIDNAVRHARSRVSIAATDEGQIVRLRVADDGPGIPLADRERVTQPGVRLDERGDGHGFGLSITRELAELHGGALTFDEAPGGGLVATATLPSAQGTTA